MRKFVVALSLIGLMCLGVFAQGSKNGRPRIVKAQGDGPPKPVGPPPGLPVDDDEVLKIETNLVTLPVSVLSQDGRFISDLLQKEFEIYEDGIKQEVSYFASVENPFSVILLLDLSPSTKYKITDIQDAAISFVEQLRRDDHITVIAFSRDVKVLSRQKNNYHKFRKAIRGAGFGDGTSLYKAVDYAVVEELKKIQGRKALVIFSDGVDTSSMGATYQSTIRHLEETDALVYPIWYNTFKAGKKTRDSTGKVIYSIGASPRENKRGKQYLKDLTLSAGGKMYEANTVKNLDLAFRSISEELRRQYSLGYYPEKDGEEGQRRSIEVRVRRPDLVVKAKSSYIVNF